MLEYVRQVSASAVNVYKFNDMTDHDIDVAPSVVWDELRAFNEDYFDCSNCFLSIRVYPKFPLRSHQLFCKHRSNLKLCARIHLHLWLKSRNPVMSWYFF